MGTELDDHGQPANPAYSWYRLQESRYDEMVGLCRGILAGGSLNFAGARCLRDWLARNKPVQSTDGGRLLWEFLSIRMTGTALEPDAEYELVGLISKIIGGTPTETNDASFSTRLPLDEPQPECGISGKCFCFTGKFAFGTRKECQQAVFDAGGFIHENPRHDTHFLVIGDLGSREWLHSTSGLKIEHAVEARSRGYSTAIISELTWRHALDRCRNALSSVTKVREREGPSIATQITQILVVRGIANLPLFGKTIVVTGTLNKMTRPQIEELIVKLGGKASGSVSKKTSFLIAGESAGSKLDKAKELKVDVLSEEEFLSRFV